ncbi:hypothetical protein KJ878_06680 [Patescibacteria group bacterium]|nr:hypothetical protein [Patescibacteria group bacterium]
MIDLSYKIGGLDISEGGLKLSGHHIQRYGFFQKDGGRFLAPHFYLVENQSEVIAIYISGSGTRHAHVAGHFDLKDDNLVGGGNCYIDLEDRLILDDFSGDYGTIPRNVAQKFAELLLIEIGEKKSVRGIKVNPNEKKLNDF